MRERQAREGGVGGAVAGLRSVYQGGFKPILFWMAHSAWHSVAPHPCSADNFLSHTEKPGPFPSLLPTLALPRGRQKWWEHIHLGQGSFFPGRAEPNKGCLGLFVIFLNYEFKEQLLNFKLT